MADPGETTIVRIMNSTGKSWWYSGPLITETGTVNSERFSSSESSCRTSVSEAIPSKPLRFFHMLISCLSLWLVMILEGRKG